ncbi:MAG: O-antigen ligase family protein [Parcubacteria group bacterium]
MGEKSREKKERREGSFTVEKERIGENAAPILWWVIFVGVILTLFTPFIVSSKYFFPFVGPKSIYFMALSEIIFAAWLILIIFAPKYRPKLNILTLTIILFLIIFILSSILGVDFSRSFWSKYERMTGLLMQLHLCGFFLAVSSVFQKKEDWLRIFGVSVFAAVLMSFINFYPKVMGPMAELTRGGATLGNSSFLGTYLLFNFFFAIYLFFNSKKLIKILSLIGVIIIGIALFLSTAQAALLSTIGGLILLISSWLISQNKGRIRIMVLVLSACLIVGVIVSAFFLTKPGNFLHDEIYEKYIGSTFGGRFIVWSGAWKGFLAKPWLGWGPENFEISFTKNYNPCMGTSECGADIWYDRAHNIVFDTLVTTGTLGFLSYLGIFFSVFFVLWKQFFSKNITFWCAGIFSVVLISYFIQNLTVFDMINSYLMFFLVLAFVGSISQNRENSSQIEKPVNIPLTAVILILFIFSFSISVIKSAKTDNYIIKALGFPAGSLERLDLYKETLQASSIGKYQIRDFFAQSTIELIQGKAPEEISTGGAKDELDFIIQELENTTKESPMDYRAYLKLGQVYNFYTVATNISKLSNAEMTLKRAIELSPKNQQGYWALAQTQIYQGKIDESFSSAEKALNLEPKLKTSHLIVIQIAKIAGNQTLAEEKAKNALEINPAWEPDIKSILGI